MARPVSSRAGRAERLVRVPVPRPVDPVAVWNVLASDHPDLVWSEPTGRRTTVFLGVPRTAEDVLIWGADGNPGASADRWLGQDPVEAVCAALRSSGVSPPSEVLGWWGWFGYELGGLQHGLTDPLADQPLAAFLHARRGVEIDASGHATVLTSSDDEDWGRALADRLSRPEASPSPPPMPRASATWRLDRNAYLAAIGSCLDAIHRGDAYQLCLTNRLTVHADEPIDPGGVWGRLRATHPAPYGGVVRIGGWSLVSGSPEEFLTVTPEGRASTSPIKGTRPRSSLPREDRALAEELRASGKERAENLMIVDLMRNDLSRVSEVGSVEVDRLLSIESLPSVHHLVSTVRSRLSGDALSAVAALLPAGSMTGAPKRSAMHHLAALEGGPRGVYAGAWGRMGSDGGMELAVVIRSALIRGETATVGTGGGITALSEPEAEWEEILLKAGPVLRALGVEEPPPG